MKANTISTMSPATPAKEQATNTPLGTTEETRSQPASHTSDFQERSQGLGSLREMLETFKQKEATRREEKERFYGFDFTACRPADQSNSRFVWNATIS